MLLVVVIAVESALLIAQLDLFPFQRVRWEDAAWGTLPDWIGGIGTAGALLIAAAVLSREVGARREEKLEGEKHLARLVSVFVQSVGHAGGSDTVDVAGRLWNRSDAPIWKVAVRLYVNGEPVPDRVHEVPCILPSDEIPVAVNFPDAPCPAPGTHYQLEATFKDDELRRWRRYGPELERLD
jgi:hypothetical protein